MDETLKDDAANAILSAIIKRAGATSAADQVQLLADAYAKIVGAQVQK